MDPPDREEILRFQELIKTRHRRHRRSFPWREIRDPYGITVSEFMLQRTGTARVLEKFPSFLRAFPDFAALAAAPLGEVLALWSGLGYNRRGKALRETAGLVRDRHGGLLPRDPERLRSLPGIGPATAASIAAFAFGLPAVFIETNIRRVFLHHFFPHGDGVRDREILPLVEAALDREDPREWYYALMDYGVHLRSLRPDPIRRSAHYAIQSRFAGSNRQVRGRILAALISREPGETLLLSPEELAEVSGFPLERVAAAARGLAREGMVAERDGKYSMA